MESWRRAISRVTKLPPLAAAVSLSVAFTVLAVLAATLVGEVLFPLLTGIPGRDARPAILATGALVALPIIVALVFVLIRTRERGRHLAAREALLRAAQRYARMGYWEFDVANGEFEVPDIVHQLLGDPDRGLRITIPLLLDMTHPKDRATLDAALHRILHEGTQEQLEYRVTGLGGQEATFWATGSRLLGSDGRPAKIFGLYQDISGRKAIETALRESEDHYRHAVELNPGTLWVTDGEGHTIELSSRFEALTGLSREEALRDGWLSAQHPEDREPTGAAWARSVETGAPFDVEYRLRMADGAYRWFRDRGFPRRDAGGRIIRWYGTIEDIHDRKIADHELRTSEAFASSILESTTDGIEVMSLEGRVEYINLPGRRLYEIEGDEEGYVEDWTALWSGETRAAAVEALAAARAGGLRRFVGMCPTAKGQTKWWDVTVSHIPGVDGRPSRLLAVSRDITAQKLAQEELEFLAHHDNLTGLLSRAGFRLRLEACLEGEAGRVALHFLDLDEFKSINDSLGHPAGDLLLREAARRLQGCLGRTDLIARFGGDEFAILQEGVTGPEAADALAERIIQHMAEPYCLDGNEVVVGASIGIALSGERAAGADDLLKRADIALYRAKSAGRGLHRFFEPHMEAEAEEHQRLRNELRDAAERGEFRLHYQPIVDLETARPHCFEALLRWDHPRRGLLAPGEFISLAEAMGAIEQIGEWVIRDACLTAATWPDDVSVSINLSPRQFRAVGIAEAVARALADSRLPARRLQLEITESVLLEDDQIVRSTLRDLRELGVRIAIDDFGTGYSSLGYLRRFAVDNIKIDLSFVADLSENPRTVAILWAVMGLGEELGVSITAEGVETAEQMEKLRLLGCRFGQGYLFAHPMPPAEVPALLAAAPNRGRGEAASSAARAPNAPPRGLLH